MSRYDGDYNDNGVVNMNRQRDLVLSVNEFCFLQSKTNGAIKTYTGPITMTISAQESLVVFNPKTKRFEETQDFEKARQLFVSAPENWYIVLKNPASDGSHPEPAKAVNSANLDIGKKINIAGPCSFSLFPGQMAKVVQGHRLRSNQYLLARVYDAAAAEKGIKSATIVDAEGNEVEHKTEHYHSGQLLVIKGTEVSFYIPPTGIEVIACDNKGNNYIRDAITLERLEYAILKDEDGNKRYCHGPAVVFPEPTETFVETPNGGNIFRALELSPISGIYIKVIAPYKDEKGVDHPIGEELFITGNDQMIYYPRPEHAMIQYDGKYMHHAIAIPEGEGRYILNRLTGEIKTIRGPKMYLPDPRTEVVVKRKLSRKECELFYPGNQEVLAYNDQLTEQATERAARKGLSTATTDFLNNVYSTADQASTLAIFEANANISRGTSYTKPRTITLDTKYEGVVSIDVWTGYAINVVSKNGKREIVVGPTTRLLDYDETLEAINLSTGEPKSEKNIYSTAFLRVENNKISDLITVYTKDFVSVQLKVSYDVDFLNKYKEKWFSVENYVKHLCDKVRTVLKQEVQKYTIEEFYTNATQIVHNVVLDFDEKTSTKDRPKGRFFPENGMLVKDVELLSVAVQTNVAKILETHQNDIVEKTLSLSEAAQKAEVTRQLAEYQQKEQQLNYEVRQQQLNLDAQFEKNKILIQNEIDEKKRAADAAKAQAEADLQDVLTAIEDAKNAREIANNEVTIDFQRRQAEIEKAKQESYAETIKQIVSTISPDLIAALTTKANANLLETATKNMSAYAIANGESVADTVNRLMRGTSLEGIIESATK